MKGLYRKVMIPQTVLVKTLSLLVLFIYLINLFLLVFINSLIVCFNLSLLDANGTLATIINHAAIYSSFLLDSRYPALRTHKKQTKGKVIHLLFPFQAIKYALGSPTVKQFSRHKPLHDIQLV